MQILDLEQQISAKSADFIDLFTKKNFHLVTAESLTGGLISASLVQHSGSSAFFDCAFTTYTNEAKEALLGVPNTIIKECGAVSEKTVIAMVQGALLRAPLADYGVAVSGIAGPTGGSTKKPVGTVWMALAHKKDEQYYTYLFHYSGSREEIRLKTTLCALEGLYTLIDKGTPKFSSISADTLQ